MRKHPSFLIIPNGVMRRRDLDMRDKLALGLIVFRHRIGSRIGATELSEVFGWDRTTGWRAMDRLREAGLIDENDAPIAEAFSGVPGFMKVPLSLVREVGGLEAAALIFLQGLPSLKMCRWFDKHMQVPAGALSKWLGVCKDTAFDLLKRLSSGVTNVVRRAQRKGLAVAVRARIEIVRAAGRAMLVRVIGEREQKQRKVKRPRLAAPGCGSGSGSGAGHGSTSQASLPSREALAAMMAAGKRQRAP